MEAVGEESIDSHFHHIVDFVHFIEYKFESNMIEMTSRMTGLCTSYYGLIYRFVKGYVMAIMGI